LTALTALSRTVIEANGAVAQQVDWSDQRENLPQLIQEAALKIRPFDPGAHDLLLQLGEAVRPGADPTGWVKVDLGQVIGYQAAFARARSQPLANQRLARLELVRNLLIFVPLLLTWFALALAAGSFDAAIRADETLIVRPFPLLWEEGFHGYVPAWLQAVGRVAPILMELSSWLKLSTVALFDAALVTALLVISGFIHKDVNVAQAAREMRVNEAEVVVRNALSRAALYLADLGSESAVSREIRDISRRWFNEVGAFVKLAESYASERSEESTRLASFGTDLREGVLKLVEVSSGASQQVKILADLSETFEKRVTGLSEEQTSLVAVMDKVRGELQRHNDVQEALEGRLTATTELLAEAAGVSTQSTAQAGRSMELAMAELRDLREHLAEERTAYTEAAQSAELSADALVAASGAVREFVERLDQTRDALRELAEPLGTAGTLLTTAALQHSEAARRGEVAADRIAEAATLQQSSARSLDTATGELIGAGTSMQRASDSLGDAAGELRGAAGALHGSGDALEGAAGRLSHSGDLLEDATRGLGDAGWELRSAGTDQGSAAETMARTSGRLEELITELRATSLQIAEYVEGWLLREADTQARFDTALARLEAVGTSAVTARQHRERRAESRETPLVVADGPPTIVSGGTPGVDAAERVKPWQEPSEPESAETDAAALAVRYGQDRGEPSAPEVLETDAGAGAPGDEEAATSPDKRPDADAAPTSQRSGKFRLPRLGPSHRSESR
jgi:hypothetical protein